MHDLPKQPKSRKLHTQLQQALPSKLQVSVTKATIMVHKHKSEVKRQDAQEWVARGALISAHYQILR